MKTLKSILRNDTIKNEVVPTIAFLVGIIAAVVIPLSPMF